MSRFQSQFNHIYQPMVGADSYYIWRFPESYPQSSSMFESDSQNGNHPANLGTGHGHGIRCFKLKIRSFPHHVPKKWHLGRSRNMSCAARSSFFYGLRGSLIVVHCDIETGYLGDLMGFNGIYWWIYWDLLAFTLW